MIAPSTTQSAINSRPRSSFSGVAAVAVGVSVGAAAGAGAPFSSPPGDAMSLAGSEPEVELGLSLVVVIASPETQVETVSPFRLTLVQPERSFPLVIHRPGEHLSAPAEVRGD